MRTKSMNDMINAFDLAEFDLAEEDVFATEVTDEALEAAAGAPPQHGKAFTVNLCTVMADCSM